MKTIDAKILDETHLELSQPIHIEPGAHIRISVAEQPGEYHVWRKAGKERFLEAYDEQDSIYDEL